jgi:tricarballylate dehydrogenase
MDRGAKTVSDPRQCHAVAIDARSPRFDGGIITRVDCLPFGIVVNKHAARFYDEGEDFWPKRYAIWGLLIARQPNQIAFAIIDSKAMGLFIPPVLPPIQASSIRDLALALNLDPAALEQTVAAFNLSVRPGKFDHAVLDSCSTAGLNPPKTHWARRLDSPPFLAYPLRPGITFTYLGVAVNERAQVLLQDDKPVENIFAAGEIMAGNILGRGYLAGLGMAIGTVFGRIAGEEAARRALA